LDFSIAELLKPSPTVQVSPQLSSPGAKDESRQDCKSKHPTSIDLSSINPSSSSPSALNSSISSKEHTSASSISQSEHESSGQALGPDCTTLSFSGTHISSPNFAIAQAQTLPQPFDLPIYYGATMPHYIHLNRPQTPSSRINLTTSNYPHFCSNLHSPTLFSMQSTSTTTSLVKTAVNDFELSTTRGSASNSDSKVNENSMNDNGVALLTISRKKNKKERRLWRCPVCKKTCNSSASLRMHKQSHSRPWKCNTCGMAFSRKWILEVHERRHTGKKPFTCPVCQHSFTDRSNMRRHMQTHMKVKRSRRPHCP
ncbi:Zinc finger protein SNAI1, partial [Taenia solium]